MGAWLLSLSTLLSLNAAACGASPPCLGLARGDTVSISLVEPWDTNSQFAGPHNFPPLTCNPSVGFASGQTFTATLTSFGGDGSCASGVADSFAIGDWTWTQDPGLHNVASGGVLEGNYLTTHAGCDGRLTIDVRASALPSGAPQPGQRPTATAHFMYNPSGQTAGAPGCPAACGGEMVATVEKL